MPNNLLLTGPPRCGKTTVITRIIEGVEVAGYRVGGLLSPETKREGERVGFDAVDVKTGERTTLASVDRETGPRVGKYRVAVENLDELAERVFDPAGVDLFVIDEIAPMEVHSDTFVRGARAVFDADIPVVATVHYRSDRGCIGEVKARDDAEIVLVDRSNRDALPERLLDRIRPLLES